MGIEEEARRKIADDDRLRQTFADRARPKATPETLEYVALARRRGFPKYPAVTYEDVTEKYRVNVFRTDTTVRSVRRPTGYSVYYVTYSDSEDRHHWAIREDDGVTTNCWEPNASGDVYVEGQLGYHFDDYIGRALVEAAAQHLK